MKHSRMRVYITTIFTCLFLVLAPQVTNADFPGSDKPMLQSITKAGERSFTIDILNTISPGVKMTFKYRIGTGSWSEATIVGFYAYDDEIVNYATPPSGEVNELRLSASEYTIPYIIDEGPSDVTVVWDAATDLGAVEESDVTFSVSYTDGADWFSMSDAFDIDLVPLGTVDTFTATHMVDPELGGYMSVVMWKDATESAWYKLEREDVETGERMIVRGYSANTTVADSGVEKGSKYVYYATVRDSSYNESAESSLIVTIPSEVTDNRPPAPTGVTATGVPIMSGSAHQTGVHVEWDTVAEADNGYFVYDGSSVALYSGLANGMYHYGLKPGDTYSYTVYAVNSLGLASESSETVSITLPIISAPAAPTGVSAVAVSESEVTVSWTTIPGLTYEVSDGAGNFLRSISFGGTFSHTGLTAGTDYTYKIKAQRGGLESEFSSTVSVTTPNTPESDTDGGGDGSGGGGGAVTPPPSTDAFALTDEVSTRTRLDLPAECPAIYTGDRVSIIGSSAVYYITAEGTYKFFPSSHEYQTWYDSYDGIVQDVPQSCFFTLRKASKTGMTFRPGARLLKNRLDRDVYAITPGGVIRAIPDEATAIRLFGANWDDERIVIGDVFWGNYTLGTPLSSVRTTPVSGQVFISEGQYYQMTSDDSARRVSGAPMATRTFVRTYDASVLDSLTVDTNVLDRSRITDISRYHLGT